MEQYNLAKIRYLALEVDSLTLWAETKNKKYWQTKYMYNYGQTFCGRFLQRLTR